MQRAEQFFLGGDLNQLTDLPIGSDEMIEAGKVLLGAPSIRQYAAASGHPRGRSPASTYPTLSESLRERLVALIREGGEYAEAALYLLSHDLRARACNGAGKCVEDKTTE